MRKTLTAVLVLCGAAAALAQEGATGSQSKSPKIAIIDLEKISSDSLLGKNYAVQLETLQNEIKAETNKKQVELQKLDAQIKALQEDLEKQQSVLSEEAVEKKQQEIVRKNREREAFFQDGQQELQRMQARAQQQASILSQEFNLKVRPFIDAVVKEKSIDILLDSRVIQAANREYDVSREVILKADESERTAKAKPAAAKPADAKPAAEAAKASPSPAPKK